MDAIEQNRLTVRGVLQDVCMLHSVDPALAEAICWQEERQFDPASSRYESAFYDRYMRGMSIQDLKERNPNCPARCSYATERVHEAVSWGPMHILGATAREMGYDGPFLSGLARSLFDALNYSVKYLDYVTRLGRRKGFDGRELIERTVAAYNMGPASFDWQRIPDDNWERYVIPVIGEYDRLCREFSIGPVACR